jgi:BCD family chlorophyll transporter-like MFS transporter
MFGAILQNRQATLFFWYLIVLLAAILGQDILLEPFGGEAFGMTVRQTTRITSIWGTCVLAALLVAGLLEGRLNKRSVARWGACGALAGFLLVVASGILTSASNSVSVFYLGVVWLGLGTGLATVSNLSLMLDMTTAQNVGLFIGAWGMANAASRLLGTVLGGALRDVVASLSQNALLGYLVVFGIEALMLAVSMIWLSRIDVSAFKNSAVQPSLVERAVVASEAG